MALSQDAPVLMFMKLLSDCKDTVAWFSWPQQHTYFAIIFLWGVFSIFQSTFKPWLSCAAARPGLAQWFRISQGLELDSRESTFLSYSFLWVYTCEHRNGKDMKKYYLSVMASNSIWWDCSNAILEIFVFTMPSVNNVSPFRRIRWHIYIFTTFYSS